MTGETSAESLRETAKAAGLPVQAAYTVPEWTRLLGLEHRTLYEEHQAGRIRWVIPRGKVKGARITCEEVARWLNS